MTPKTPQIVPKLAPKRKVGGPKIRDNHKEREKQQISQTAHVVRERLEPEYKEKQARLGG